MSTRGSEGNFLGLRGSPFLARLAAEKLVEGEHSEVFDLLVKRAQ